MYILVRNSTFVGYATTRPEMTNILLEEKSRHETDYSSNTVYYQNHYGSVENYVGQRMQYYKVYGVGDSLNLSPNIFVYDSINRETVLKPELNALHLTRTFFRIEDTVREGNLKVFATVVKTGLKSTGMEVILDPHLMGSQIRPVEYYEGLVGTFSRIKATTRISEQYGWATLFFSPEALGNIRVETQQLAAKVLTIR